MNQRWRLAEVLGALESFGLQGKPMQRASTCLVERQMLIVERGAHIVVHADEEIPRLLGRLRVPHKAGQHTQLTREAWPGLPRLLRKQLSKEALHWLLRAMDRYVDVTSTSIAPIQPRRTSGSPTAGIKGLSQRLRVRAERVPDLLDELQVSLPERRTSTGRKMVVANNGVAELIRDYLNDKITSRSAQRQFGFTTSRLDMVATAGLIRRSGRGYAASSIESLLSMVVAAAHPLSMAAAISPDDLIPMHKALRVIVSREHTVAFFRDVLSGTLVSYRLNDNSKGIEDLALVSVAAKTWMLDRNPSPELLLIPQAAALLGLKQEVVYHLVRVGLLPTKLQRAGKRVAKLVALPELDRFKKQFAPLSALAHHFEIDTRSALPWARLQGLELISGPSIDGGRQYFARCPWPTTRSVDSP